jgi:hypothetical protein
MVRRTSFLVTEGTAELKLQPQAENRMRRFQSRNDGAKEIRPNLTVIGIQD